MTLAALELEVALLAAEADLLEQLIAAGILPVGARRVPSARELAAGVRFAELDRIVNDAAALLARKQRTIREHVLDGLATQLAPIDAEPDPYTALEALDRLTDPTRGDTIPGLRQLVDDVAADVRATLLTVAQQAADEAYAEAIRQGIPERLLDDVVLGPDIDAAASTHAQRVATAPATRLLDVAAEAGSRAATTPGATGATVLEGALAGAEDASLAGVEDTARQAANVTHGLGRAAAQRALPAPREVYASELLDRNTCSPCASVDGRTYDSLESGLVDYPGAGGYVGCLGGARCRGTLVLVHSTEAPPTIDGIGPGGEPIDRTPKGPTNPGRPDYLDPDGNIIPRPPDKGTATGGDGPVGMALDETGRSIVPPDVEPPISTVAPGEVPRDAELATYEDHHLEEVLADPAESLERKLAAADELDQRAAGSRTQVFHEEDLDEATLARYEDDRAAWEAAGGDVVASFTGDASGTLGGRRIDRVRAAWTEEVEHQHIAAEHTTNGYLVRRDRLAEFHAKYGDQPGATGVLFEGPARVAYYYASPELRDYWQAHERRSFAEFAMENGVTDAKTRGRAKAAAEARQEAILNSENSAAGNEKRARAKSEKARKRLPQTEGDRLVAAQKRRDRLRAAERKAELDRKRLEDDTPAAPTVLEPEETYVARIAGDLDAGKITVPELRRIAETANPLSRVNIEAGIARHEAAQQARQAAEDAARAARDSVADRVDMPTEVLDTLLPKRGGWNTGTRAKTVARLKTTPQGRQLLKTVDSFQSGGATAIPRLRTDVEKYLAGGDLPAGRVDAIENLLSAIGRSVHPDDAKPLYRGMVIPGDAEEVLARYAAGSDVDLSISSFTSDRKAAQGFSEHGAGQRVTTKRNTPVVVEWVGESKRALPIENLSKSGVFANEREWVTAGRFVVDGARKVKRNGVESVVVTMRQREVW